MFGSKRPGDTFAVLNHTLQNRQAWGSLLHLNKQICQFDTIHMYSGITSGRVLDGELLYTKILEVNALVLQRCPQVCCSRTYVSVMPYAFTYTYQHCSLNTMSL